jgi:hypothetical protein
MHRDRRRLDYLAWLKDRQPQDILPALVPPHGAQNQDHPRRTAGPRQAMKKTADIAVRRFIPARAGVYRDRLHQATAASSAHSFRLA